MKRKFLLALSVLLLCSCNGWDESLFKKEVLSQLPKESLTEATKYNVHPEGCVATSDKKIGRFYDTKRDYDLPKGTYDSSTNVFSIGLSYFVYAPIIINSKVFLSDKEQDSGSAYKNLTNQICYYADHITVLEFKKNEDGFSFFTRGVSKPLTIYNLYESEDLPDPENVNVIAKFNITLDYDKDGFLKKETIQTIDYQTKKSYVDLSCTYTYH